MIFRRANSTINWRYAFGELALIVVGVSVALAANSWYQDRAERQLEREALTQLRSELQADLTVVREHHEDLREFERSISMLLAHARSEDPYSDDMKSFFTGLASWRGIRVRTASYEEIKNRDFSLISDSSLRALIIDLYEGQFPALIGSSQVDYELTRNQIVPYLYERFLRDPGLGWAPLNYSELRIDPIYLTTV